jgi:hypothetical protein
MPSSVFLSYARSNSVVAEELEGQLTTLGLNVWRDQERLRTGTRWPKALGEAIAERDAFLLLWSADSAKSNFVELEWTTALALKKPILPVLIDQTPLPPSLAAYNATSIIGKVSDAANDITSALASEAASRTCSPENTKRVISVLAGIKSASDADALNQFRTIVQGSVYNAGGNIYIGTNPERKSLLDKWQAWIGIVVGIFTVLTLTLALWRPNNPDKPPQAITSRQQVFAGSIWDSNNEPLSGVRVSLLLNEKLLASGPTDNLGRYTFRVTAPPEADITLLAQKDGFHTEKRYTQLGNTNFNFTMSRGLQ